MNNKSQALRSMRAKAMWGRTLLTACLVAGAPSVDAAVSSCTPEVGYDQCLVYTASGVAQGFAVPAGVGTVKLKVWGAGGAGYDASYGVGTPGGSGAYAEARVPVVPGTGYTVVVGKGNGWDGSACGTAYGYGGSCSAAFGGVGGGGGGLSGFFSGIAALTESDRSRALLIAGGGGGGEITNACGYLSFLPGGGGGTGVSNPTGTMRGADSYANHAGDTGAGAGGGYNGGGYTMVGVVNPCANVQGGEGGTSFASGTASAVTLLNGSGGTNPAPWDPPNTGDMHYQAGVGVGQMIANGGDGLVVVQWQDTATWWDVSPQNNGSIDGGSGTWDATNTNWTLSPAGNPNRIWGTGQVAHFAGSAGTVTASGTPIATGLDFLTNGYTIGGSNIAFTPGVPGAFALSAAAGVTANLNLTLSGGGGSVGLNKTGPGTVVMNASSGTNGNWSISAGRLVGTVPLSLGPTNFSNQLLVQAGGTAELRGIDVLNNNAFSGHGDDGVSGAIYAPTGNSNWGVWNTAAGLGANAMSRVDSGATLGFNGFFLNSQYEWTIAGAGTTYINVNYQGAAASLTKQDSGLAVMNANSYYEGPTVVNGGTFRVGTNGGGGDIVKPASPKPDHGVDVASGANFEIQRSQAYTFARPIFGAGNFVMSGTGTTTLTANNTWGGTSTLKAGRLNVNGTQIGNGLMTVQTGATLGGTGTYGGAVTVLSGGRVSPGTSPGTLAITGDLTLNAGSFSDFELAEAGTNPAMGGSGGLCNDLLNVTGNVTLAGTLNVTKWTAGGGCASSFGTGTYRLINYTGTVSGNFTTVTLPVGYYGYVDKSILGQVNLVVVKTIWWDQGTGSPWTSNNVIDGGTGTWNAANTNWTSGPPDAPGAANGIWPNGTGASADVAHFAGTAGTVTVNGTRNIAGLEFLVNDYILTGGVLDGQFPTNVLTAPNTPTNPAHNVTIGTTLAGSNGYKFANGGYALTANATFSGPTEIHGRDSGLGYYNFLSMGDTITGSSGGLLTGTSGVTGTMGTIVGAYRRPRLQFNQVGATSNVNWTIPLHGSLNVDVKQSTTLSLNTASDFEGFFWLWHTASVNANTNDALGRTVGFFNLSSTTADTLKVAAGTTQHVFGFQSDLVLNPGSQLVYRAPLDPTLGPDDGFLGNNVKGSGTIDWTGGTAVPSIAINGFAVTPGNGAAPNSIGRLDFVAPNALNLTGATTLHFDMTTPGVWGGATNDMIYVAGNLVLDGTAGTGTKLVVNGLPGFGASGVYHLIQYTGTRTGAFDPANVTLPAGYTGYVDYSTAGEINLVIAKTTWWDGDAGPANDSIVQGGNGTWNSANTNWTVEFGQVNGPWPAGEVAHFKGSAGTVNVSGTQSISGLHFRTQGYTLSGGTLNGVAATNVISFDAPSWVNGQPSMTIDSVLSGAAGNDFRFVQLTGGATYTHTMRLGQNNTYTGGTQIACQTILELGISPLLSTGDIHDTSALSGPPVGSQCAPQFRITRSGTVDMNYPISGQLDFVVQSDSTINLNNPVNSFTGYRLIWGRPGFDGIGTGATVNVNASNGFGAAPTIFMDYGSRLRLASGVTQTSSSLEVWRSSSYPSTTVELGSGAILRYGVPSSDNYSGPAYFEADTTLTGLGTLDWSGYAGGGIDFYSFAGANANIVPGTAGTVGTLSLKVAPGQTVNMKGATLHADLAAPGTNDALSITGNIDISGPNSKLMLSSISGYNPVGTYVLVTYTGTRTGTFASNNLAAVGYQGSIVYDDANKRILLLTLPKVTLTKISTGGIGTFAFAMTGLDTASTNLTTTSYGAPGVSSVAFMGTPATAVTVMETPPPGWPTNPVGVTCLDANAALSGNPAGNLGSLSGATQTLPAAVMVSGANINCTFTNALNTTVSGKVFNDGGATSGTANDGLQNGGEAGWPSAALKLTNCAGTTYSSATTDGSGAYSLNVPTAQIGQSVCVELTQPASSVTTGANAAGTVTPDGSATTVGGVVYTFTRASNREAFTMPSSGTPVLNFAVVPESTLIANGTRTVAPGGQALYMHRFTAGTAGSLSLSAGPGNSVPSVPGWAEVIYRDVGCTGTVQSGAAQLYPPSVAVAVTQGELVCFALQQFAPVNAANGTVYTLPVTASLVFGNATPGIAKTYTVTDTTTVSTAAVRVEKLVRNVTQGGAWVTTNNAKPGDELEYQITYTNLSADVVNDLVIADATPAFTTFVSASEGTRGSGLTACAKNTPANPLPGAGVPCSDVQPAGGSGAVGWKFTGSLSPSGTGTVTYKVLVN